MIVIGQGVMKKNAAKNAAHNALTSASPRDIRHRRVIRYREELENDIFKDLESIRDTRFTNYGFNKGEIVTFQVINTSVENSIYSVIANVQVSKAQKYMDKNALH